FSLSYDLVTHSILSLSLHDALPIFVRQLIGVTGQYASVDESLSATENLVIFSRLLGLSRSESKRKAKELLEEFGLSEAAKRPLKDRKSTRLNSSHVSISYAVFCLKK